jgi:perosamine synthetase
LNLEFLNSRLHRSFPRVPLAVPFWSGETYRNILRCIVSGEIIVGPDLVELKSQLLAHFGVPDLVLCGSGSLALELALRVCDLRAGDEVIIPTMCCSAVVAPILALGATPVLADAGSELNVTVETVDAVRTRKTRAVIVPHLFGNPADIGLIAELGNANNIVVIDDAAQALGATIDDQPVGSCGDMGVISFGAEKICFGLGGGVLVAHSGGVLDAARQFVLGYPSVGHTLARMTSTLIRRRWRRWTLPFQRLHAFGHERSPEALPEQYRQESMANLNAAVTRSLVASLPNNLQARRARVQAYRELLGNHAGVELIGHRPGSACLTQVLRVLPKRSGDDAAARIIGALGQAGYEVQGSYLPIHLLAQFPQCVWDSLPYAERVWADLVELPCEPSVSMADVESIAALVKRVLTA